MERFKTARTLAVAATAVTWLAMIQGRIVNVTGASKAVPDWPLCNGRLIPPFGNPLVFLEWLHRLLILASVLLAGALLVAAWRRGTSAALRAGATAAVGLVVVTGAIGAVATTRPLHPAWAAIDLALAMLYFGTLVALSVWSSMGLRREAGMGHPS